MRRDALRGKVPRQWLVSGGGGRWACVPCMMRVRAACVAVSECISLQRTIADSLQSPASSSSSSSIALRRRWAAARAPSPTAGSTCGGTTCTGSGEFSWLCGVWWFVWLVVHLLFVVVGDVLLW